MSVQAPSKWLKVRVVFLRCFFEADIMEAMNSGAFEQNGVTTNATYESYRDQQNVQISVRNI